MTDTFVRHLTDGELVEVLLGGPDKLLECLDNVHHMHIVHDQCMWCIERLMSMIVLHQATRDLKTKH